MRARQAHKLKALSVFEMVVEVAALFIDVRSGSDVNERCAGVGWQDGRRRGEYDDARVLHGRPE